MPYRFFRYCALWPVAILAACAALDSPDGSQRTPSLRVGISGDYPPFCLATADPAAWLGYRGFDLDLLRQLARDLDLPQAQAVPFQWPNLVKTLAENGVDLAVCGITVRPDRARAMIFTRPYAVSGAMAAVPRRDSARFKALTDLDQPGIRLGVNAGGHLERVTRARFPRAMIQTTRNNLELQNLLKAGIVDAVVSDTIEAASWRDVALLGPFTHDRKAMALPLDGLDLRDHINDWLAAREADGWLPRQRKALGDQATLSPEQVCAEALSASLDQRFSLMPLVAAVKRRDGLPITDPEQEAKVLGQAKDMTARQGLPESEAARLFTVLMGLSKSIQERNRNTNADGFSLPELRRAVAGASSSLLPEIRRCARTLADHPGALETALRRDLGKWLDTDQIKSLLDVLPPRAFGPPESGPRHSSERSH